MPIFLEMERTPCLGNCPGYTITIYENGHVVYNGRNFVEREGKYTMQMTEEQIQHLKNYAQEIGFFGMKDKYDSAITDIPSVIIMMQYEDYHKKILDRVDGPKDLKKLEKLVDQMVLNDKLKKVEETE